MSCVNEWNDISTIIWFTYVNLKFIGMEAILLMKSHIKYYFLDPTSYEEWELYVFA